MQKLTEMISRRDELRDEERKLTQQIKAERAANAAKRKEKAAAQPARNERAEYWERRCKEAERKLSLLRGAYVLVSKNAGSTWAEIAERLELSAGRCRDLADRAERLILHAMRDDHNEELRGRT